MIVIGGFLLGAFMGGSIAYKRKGKLADILQYAAGFGIAFCIIGLFATIFIERLY